LYNVNPSSEIIGLTAVSFEERVADNVNELLEFDNKIRGPNPSSKYTLSGVGDPYFPGITECGPSEILPSLNVDVYA
jgi:hypothetical protein